MNKGQVIKRAAYDWVKCSNPNCHKIFPRAKKESSGGHHGNGVRGRNALTCSPNCSKVYTEIVKRRWKLNKRNKANNEKK